MAGLPLPDVLRPDPGERGLLSDWSALSDRIERSWQRFVSIMADVDLSAPTRSSGRAARELLIPLGAWPDARGIHQMVDEARTGVTDVEPISTSAQRLRDAHEAADDGEVRAMVRRSAEHVSEWLAEPGARDSAQLTAPSPLGQVPLGTALHAAAFQLAATARDLRPAGASSSADLDSLGVVALVDASGAVAARMGATASIAAVTPQVAAGTGTTSTWWRTAVQPGEDEQLGPAVIGPAGLLIDIAAGRIDVMGMARDLRLRDGRGLVGMSVVLDGIPDLPAAGMLRRAGSLLRWGRLG